MKTKRLEAMMLIKDAKEYADKSVKWKLPNREEAVSIIKINKTNSEGVLYLDYDSNKFYYASTNLITGELIYRTAHPLFKFKVTLVDTGHRDFIKEIGRFATDRSIDKMKPNQENYIANVLEELLEHIGLDVPKESRNIMMDKFRVTTEELLLSGVVSFKDDIIDSKATSMNDRIDSIADVMVFSMTELLKYGMDIEKVMSEVTKEINSRTGSIINGKFEKDLSDEARSKWYKASYDKCKGGN